MTCSYSQRIDAFHDGELGAAEAKVFQEHLEQCPACQGQVAQARALSALLASAAVPQLPEEAMGRLHQAAQKVQEYGIVRIAEWLTAAAAAVLLIGLLGLYRAQPSSVQPAAPWERAMVTMQVDASAPAGGESLQLAHWMTSSLAAKGIDE